MTYNNQPRRRAMNRARAVTVAIAALSVGAAGAITDLVVQHKTATQSTAVQKATETAKSSATTSTAATDAKASTGTTAATATTATTAVTTYQGPTSSSSSGQVSSGSS